MKSRAARTDTPSCQARHENQYLQYRGSGGKVKCLEF
jgi:hypothetical protein